MIQQLIYYKIHGTKSDTKIHIYRIACLDMNIVYTFEYVYVESLMMIHVREESILQSDFSRNIVDIINEVWGDEIYHKPRLPSEFL